MDTWDTVLAAFERSLEKEGLAADTIRAYVTDASQLVDELCEAHVDPPEVDEEALQEAFWSNLDGWDGKDGTLHFSASTIRRKASSFNRFEQFLQQHGLLERLGARLRSAAQGLTWRRQKILTEEDLAEVLSSPDRNTLLGARDAAILALIVFCGMRSREISCLALNDLSDNCKHISTKESAFPREVWVPPYVARRLEKWIGLRSMFAKSTKALFVSIGKGDVPSPGGHRLTARGIRKIISKYLKLTSGSDMTLTVGHIRKSGLLNWKDEGAIEGEMMDQYAVTARTLRAYMRFEQALFG